MSDVVYEPADHFTDKSNHLQISIGPMYSIGRELKFEDARANSSHRFFDRTNLALFGTSLLAQTADAITTQHFLKACRSYSPGSNCSWKEGDPLARPFVQYGWPGQIGAAVLVNGLQISAVYAIHKMGHHKIERFVTLPFTAVSAWAARDNAKLY
jgi:hypothetical protein